MKSLLVLFLLLAIAPTAAFSQLDSSTDILGKLFGVLAQPYRPKHSKVPPLPKDFFVSKDIFKRLESIRDTLKLDKPIEFSDLQWAREDALMINAQNDVQLALLNEMMNTIYQNPTEGNWALLPKINARLYHHLRLKSLIAEVDALIAEHSSSDSLHIKQKA